MALVTTRLHFALTWRDRQIPTRGWLEANLALAQRLALLVDHRYNEAVREPRRRSYDRAGFWSDSIVGVTAGW
jgi:hypothetical protein